MNQFTMNAMQLIGFGGLDQLVWRTDLAIPQPKDDEVLIQVGACGINNTDVWTREGAYGASDEAGWQGGQFEFPRIQGADIVGHIAGVGATVPKQRLGQRVMVNPTIYGSQDNPLFDARYVGSEVDGGFAQYACVPATNALAVHSSLSDAELATFMIPCLTALHMLNRANLGRGETLLVTGASGGVGSSLVQIGSILGARVIAIASRAYREPLLKLGAQDVIAREDLGSGLPLPDLLQGIQPNVVADVVAGSQVLPLLEVLAVGGRYVTAGAIAGPMVTLDWRTLYLRHLTLLGSTMGQASEAAQVVRWIESGQLKPQLARSYRLHELHQAQRDFKAKGFFGKLVIQVGDSG
jgi:NADPH:quinone reductase-like Zn-dependent oxidoreductase